MLIVQKRIPPQSGFDALLALPFEQRQKSRLRTTVAGGEEIGIFLERGSVLRGQGATVTPVAAPFEPEAGAYGGRHAHDGETTHGGIIHDFGAGDRHGI